MDLARRYLSRARQRGIELVGITEHNDVSWIDELRRAAHELDMHLLPGFEVESAEGVHVLCLFDPDTPVAHLEEGLVGLGLTRARRQTRRLERRTDQHFGELVKFVQDQKGGVCIAAHIESDKGLLAALDRGGARVDLWKTPALLAAQISKPPKEITSRNGAIIRNEDPNYRRARLPAYLLTSDCRSLETIGAISTWLKMDTVGVGGLRQAFLDPQSRIAYADPAQLREGAHLLAVSWEGDFLDGVRFSLNPELNCLIGGKGTGKSTVVESIRYAFDLGYRTDEVGGAAKDLLEHAFRSGSKVSLVIETDAPARKRYIVERTAPHAPVVRDGDGQPRPDLEPHTLVRPCIYGQKEIFGIAQNTRARLDMLDGFAADDLRDVLAREAQLLEDARESASLILTTQRRIDDADSKLSELPSLEEWRARFRQAGFEDLLHERRQLDREERLLSAADKGLVERERVAAGLAGRGDLADAVSGAPEEELPNAELLSRAQAILGEADLRWEASIASLREEVAQARARLAEVRSTWGDRRAARQAEFDSALRDLQARMPEVDPERYLDVERRIEQLTPLRSALTQLNDRLTAARDARARLLVELNEARGEKHRVRQRAADRLSHALAGNVLVELTYQGAREDFIRRLAALKSGARADALQRMTTDSTFTPTEFAARARARTLGSAWNLPAGQATALERSLDEETLLALETAELTDQVELLLDVSLTPGTSDYRALDRLSPGQKSTAILMLVMQESKDPLVVDQPEDDLDNRFIYDDIVKRLKAAKPTRQFLIATHNANIPILGDAEQIVALDAQESPGGGRVSSFVRARGSIDASPVRDAAEQILEGGREAFALRQAKYRA
jgi:PHP family Zn ribbon phosphoesterase